MTSEEIMTAFEHCAKHHQQGCCSCPLRAQTKSCDIKLYIQVLDLISRKNDEIMRLRAENDALKSLLK